MQACGVDTEEFRTVDLYSSHEALLLDYERPLTRIDSRTGTPYDVSAHFLWVGERTRGARRRAHRVRRRHPQPDRGEARPDHDARRRARPGRAARPAAAARPADVRHPDGRGAGPRRAAADRREGHRQRRARGAGSATRCTATRSRRRTAARPGASTTSSRRCAASSRCTARSAPTPAVLHIELTGDDVTECLGGSGNIGELDLPMRYQTACDPRLNHQQSLELAFLVAEMLAARLSRDRVSRAAQVDRRLAWVACRSTCAATPSPGRPTRCARRWPPRRSATTSTARTRPSPPSRSGSPLCSGTRRRCSPRPARWPTSSACGCSCGRGRSCSATTTRTSCAPSSVRRRAVGHHDAHLARGVAAELDVDAVAALMRPDAGPYFVSTAAVVVENTHNFGGGTVQPLDDIARLRDGDAVTPGVLHASRRRPAVERARRERRRRSSAYGALFDTVSVCLSKGLGAPVGSLLASSTRAHRRGADLAQAARRRHAAGRHPRRGRPATRSTTTSTGWPTTTRGPAGSPRSSPPLRRDGCDPDDGRRPTSWCSRCPTLPRWWRAAATRAC